MAKLIGNAPNQVPTNADLGSMAFEDKKNYATTSSPIYQPFRNLIINGDMSIAQRGTSATGISSGLTYNTVDRFATEIGGIGTWTQTQSTDVPSGQGFAKSFKMDCTTADASPAVSDYAIFQQRVEGKNLQYLRHGTVNAKSLTMSFWVKSNKTGTYIVELANRDSNNKQSQSYTINSANTWEKKILTYEGNSGVFNNDNGNALDCYFWLGGGTTYTSGTLNTSWSNPSAANRAAGQVNLGDSTANEWYITGVQLEAGTSASDFEFLPHDVNFQRCQRYFYKWVATHNFNNICIGKVSDVKSARGVYQLPTIMRSSPSLSADGNFRMVASGIGTGTGSDISVIRNNTDTQFLFFNFSSGTDSTVNQACEMGANSDAAAKIEFSAEL